MYASHFEVGYDHKLKWEALMFEAVPGKVAHVHDPDSGVEVFLRGLPDHEKLVNIRFLDGRTFSFVILIEPKDPKQSIESKDKPCPAIRIQMGDLNLVAKAVEGSIEENTQVINLMLTGLSRINKIWPLWRNPLFYSDRDKYAGQEHKFLFRLPSEEDISRL